MPSTNPHLPLRRHVTLPGILRETIHRRMAEFRYPTFAPFGLELICFDLRKRREHIITREIDDYPPAIQEAIDRDLVRHYQPGQKRNGLIMQALFRQSVEAARELPRGSFAAFQSHVRCPQVLQPCIEERWRELGYPNFSRYLTGVIRYDLLLLGPHKYYNGDDTDPEMLASLDMETARTFAENKPQPIFLDVAIDEAAGRRLTHEERTGIMHRATREITERATKGQRGENRPS